MLVYDPEVQAALQDLGGHVMEEEAPRGDVMTARANNDLGAKQVFDTIPLSDDPTVKTLYRTHAADGHVIPMNWYGPVDSAAPRSCVVYVHGGGMISGSIDIYDRAVRYYHQLTGVPFLAVGYRLAPESTGTAPAEDVLTALEWVIAHAGEMGIDASRIAVMGDSGGGGIAAGVAILARDKGLVLAKQILIYPMLDDRNTEPDPLLAPTATWGYDSNFTGWFALLGETMGTPDVDPVAAPARLAHHEGLSPAFIEVGDMDIFRDEDIDFAVRLLRAGVPCELHVYPGLPHAYEWLAWDSAPCRRSMELRRTVIQAL